MFGKNLHIFAAQTNNLNSTNNKKAATKYLDLCKPKIFLAVCREYYIASESFDTDIIVQDVCLHIAKPKQRWIHNRKYTTNIPNDLFFKLNGLAASLSEN